MLIIRVPRSYRGPHRVIFKGWNRFFARSSAGRYEPNVEELRALFAFAPELAERMRSFRFERVAKIAADDTPVPLQEPLRLVLHVVPFSHFDLGPSLAMTEVVTKPHHFAAIGALGGDHRLNVDGFLTMSNPNDKGAHRAYTQVFRTGAVEAVACLSSPKIVINHLDRI